jgi:hypothetical protein
MISVFVEVLLIMGIHILRFEIIHNVSQSHLEPGYSCWYGQMLQQALFARVPDVNILQLLASMKTVSSQS